MIASKKRMKIYTIDSPVGILDVFLVIGSSFSLEVLVSIELQKKELHILNL